MSRDFWRQAMGRSASPLRIDGPRNLATPPVDTPGNGTVVC
jgi:hypothetical protein